jgi:hypothetical protein
VQAEHDARGADQRRERHEHPQQLREVCAGLPGEGHRVQGMPGGEAVAIQGRCCPIDAGVRDEGSLAHEQPLEEPIDEHPEGTGERHHRGRPYRARPVKQRQRQQQRVPGKSVAQAARDLEDAPRQRERGAPIEPAAQAVLGGIHARHECYESGRSHDAYRLAGTCVSAMNNV